MARFYPASAKFAPRGRQLAPARSHFIARDAATPGASAQCMHLLPATELAMLMLIQILTHTPLYVWAILAFLLWRGVAEMRDRELTLRRMLILPLVMLGLSLNDMALKFDLGAPLIAAWSAGCAAAMLLAWRLGRTRIAAGTAPDLVLVRGSVMPLILMLAIFLTKYITSVVLVIQPHLAHQLAVAATICLVFGVFNGVLLGRLARMAGAVGQQRAGLPAAV
jgi:hypothetical protein